ncbi:hypothetical protein KUTeg_005026 [Tegillarca granosa]|uniref:Peptidoglycan-recognition protein n=1 Tax=Tegillarca granosa TaxID=220873 RepID=A0ABQ9FIK7_TEGGR|nr:hypothetical protein KUTeg_005026 [Tegillarca granosa]
MCHNRNGTCQEDNLPCSGHYVNNHCSGHASRRCCLPSESHVQDSGYCSNVKVISRDSWGARRPSSILPISTPVPLFFIHHTAGHTCFETNQCIQALKGIQNYHIDSRGYNDIGYSFLIGQDGNVYEGRGWNSQGAHTKNHNDHSFAASFMGNFMSHLPVQKALDAAQALIECGVAKGYIEGDYSLYGHRDVKATSCPGDSLYNHIRAWPHYNTVPPTLE